MIKSEKYLVPVLCLIVSISLLYAKTFITRGSPSQSFQSKTVAGVTDHVITIHYHERPPYYITGTLDVYGLCVDPVKSAFKEAGIAVRWEKKPANRQLDIIKGNRSNDCIIGWFKNIEREKYARFSHYIYQDLPAIALARADNNNILSNQTAGAVLSNPDLVLLKKRGYSYGNFIDTRIAELNPEQVITSARNIGMLEMIYSKRADYFFISKEEALTLTAGSGLPYGMFKFIYFTDMPRGNKRYLLFSKRVDKKVIEKINTALKQYIHGRL